MITEIEDYFAKGCGRCARFATSDCSARRWSEGLAELRRICREAGLEEAVKWGHPCYMHAGRNITVFGAFRDDFRMSFMNAALLRDPDGVLEKSGPNARHREVIRFRENGAAAALEPVIRATLEEAMGYAEAGTLPRKEPRAIDLPDELVKALAADPELAEAFNGLTPGRQRSYAINLAGAKKPETRVTRIAKFRPQILAGKGALER